MSEQTRYYLTELLMKHNLPKVQGRELVFAEYHDAEIAKLKEMLNEAAEVFKRIGMTEQEIIMLIKLREAAK